MACASEHRHTAGPSRPARRRDRGCPSRTRDLPLALWPCAQRTAQVQRQGRFVAESNRHPAKMLPEIARRAIAAYSDPGDLVLDPMCGIATTLVEAIHLGRCAIGVELEPRWAALALENITHARSRGAFGQATVVQGDARQVGDNVLAELVGEVPLILTSPPYGNADVGDPRRGNGIARTRAAEGRRVTAADRALALQLKQTKRYGDSSGSIAALRYGHIDLAPTDTEETYLSTMQAIYTGLARMLKPDGYLIVVSKNLRAKGSLRNIAGDTITLCQRSGLLFQQHIVALLAALRDDELFPRPGYFQLTQVRHALARGERQHLVCHEDVLVFRRDPKR